MTESTSILAEATVQPDADRTPDGLRVEFHEDGDPRLFCTSTGEEVTTRCGWITITVYPRQHAEAMLYRHRNGKPYLDERTGSVAIETLPVVEMTGTWRRACARRKGGR